MLQKLSTILATKGDMKRLISVGVDLIVRTLLVAESVKFRSCAGMIKFLLETCGARRWQNQSHDRTGRTRKCSAKIIMPARVEPDQFSHQQSSYC